MHQTWYRSLTTTCSSSHQDPTQWNFSYNFNIIHVMCVSRTGTGICGWEEVPWGRLSTGGKPITAEGFSIRTLFWLDVSAINSTPLLWFLVALSNHVELYEVKLVLLSIKALDRSNPGFCMNLFFDWEGAGGFQEDVSFKFTLTGQ